MITKDGLSQLEKPLERPAVRDQKPNISQNGSLSERAAPWFYEPSSLGSSDCRAIIPQIHIQQGIVHCNDGQLDLRSKPVPLKLFQVFIRRCGESLNRQDLLAELYDICHAHQYSPRYIQSTYANMVKMISRTRKQALALLSSANNSGIEWFVYDQNHRTWTFYQLSSDYVRRQLLHRNH